MRIYYSPSSDPVITDTLSGLNTLSAQLQSFLASEEKRLFVRADTSGSPEPYASLLDGVEFKKSTGPILVSIEPAVGLQVSGSVENLCIWCSYFQFPASAVEGDHHHPEHVQRSGYLDSNTLSVIIEVRDEAENAL
jgi:hypothetical protein